MRFCKQPPRPRTRRFGTPRFLFCATRRRPPRPGLAFWLCVSPRPRYRVARFPLRSQPRPPQPLPTPNARLTGFVRVPIPPAPAPSVRNARFPPKPQVATRAPRALTRRVGGSFRTPRQPFFAFPLLPVPSPRSRRLRCRRRSSHRACRRAHCRPRAHCHPRPCRFRQGPAFPSRRLNPDPPRRRPGRSCHPERGRRPRRLFRLTSRGSGGRTNSISSVPRATPRRSRRGPRFVPKIRGLPTETFHRAAPCLTRSRRWTPRARPLHSPPYSRAVHSRGSPPRGPVVLRPPRSRSKNKRCFCEPRPILFSKFVSNSSALTVR